MAKGEAFHLHDKGAIGCQSLALTMSRASSPTEANLFAPARQFGKNGNGFRGLCQDLITGDVVTLSDQEFLNRLWSFYPKPKQGVGFLVRSAMVTYQLEVCYGEEAYEWQEGYEVCSGYGEETCEWQESYEVCSGKRQLMLIACLSPQKALAHLRSQTQHLQSHPLVQCHFGNLRFMQAEWRPMSCFNSENMRWDSEENAFRYFLFSNNTNFNNPQQSQWL